MRDTINRIIFLMDIPFTLRDYQRLGIELLRQNGFRVEAWDVSYILHREVLENCNPSDLFNYDGLNRFNNGSEACFRLSGLSCSDFVITSIIYNPSSLRLYRALSRSSAAYAIRYVNALPFPVIKRNIFRLLIDNLRSSIGLLNPKSWQYLFMKFPLRFLRIRPAAWILLGGNSSFDFWYYNYYNIKFPVDKNTKLVWIHALDYDLYLQERDKPCSEKPIAVFLDQFLPFHPLRAYIMSGEDAPIIADRYYSLLNNFFDLIEKETGLEIVIAAHPRSDYGRVSDYFRGRRCIKGETASLVKECKLVLNHASTAVNFAVLFYKPIIFITYSELDKRYEGSIIKEMAKCFKKSPIFIDKIDDSINLKEELKVDVNHYDNYKRSYIKREDSEDLAFSQIVANRLKNTTAINSEIITRE